MSVFINFKGHIDFFRAQKPRILAFLLFFIYETASHCLLCQYLCHGRFILYFLCQKPKNKLPKPIIKATETLMALTTKNALLDSANIGNIP